MQKIFYAISLVLLLSISLVSAHEHNFAETKKLIDSKISCDRLTDEQLEAVGEYYMEQMHPGEAHELMDKMMGGEGSESLRQMHINMAKRIYCNEDVSGTMGMMSGGMMSMMMGGNMGYGMMGNYGYGFGYWNFVNILYIILLIGLIILVYLWVLKLWRNMKNKGSKK